MKNKIEIPVIREKVVSKPAYEYEKVLEDFESELPIEELIKNPKEFDDFIKKEKIEIDWLEFCSKYDFNDEFILYYADKFLKYSCDSRISQMEALPLNFIEKNRGFLYMHFIASINKNLNLEFLIKFHNYFYLSSLIENEHLSDELLAEFVKSIGIAEAIFKDNYINEKNSARISKILKIAYKDDIDTLLSEILKYSISDRRDY